MSSNLDKYRKDLVRLISTGDMLSYALQSECFPKEFEKVMKKAGRKDYHDLSKKLPQFKNEYQEWYSEAHFILKQLLPDRLSDFVSLYEKQKGRRNISHDNYVIEDYLAGLTVTQTIGFEKEVVVGLSAAIPRFEQQLNILKSVVRRFESALFEIKHFIQADLFDSELDAARDLLKKGFMRASGAIAGVVLEKHLKQVCDNHNVDVKKQHPTIGDLNDVLKNTKVIELVPWRHIQFLADIRNLCDHNRNVEPTESQVLDLINGSDKILKTVL